MRRGIGKRALSLALALELFCTPLAVARAEDPAQARSEIPLGQEAVPAPDAPADVPVFDDIPLADLPAQSGDEPGGSAQGSGDTAQGSGSTGQSSDAAAPAEAGEVEALALPGLSEAEGFVVPDDLKTKTTLMHHLGLSYGLSYDVNQIMTYNGYLKQESEEAYYAWGYDGGRSRSNTSRTLALGTDDYFYFWLPDMGRVPDLELEGIYLYPNALTETPTAEGSTYAAWLSEPELMRQWSYREDSCVRLELEAVPEADVEATSTALYLPKPSGLASYTLVRFANENEEGEPLIDETNAYHYLLSGRRDVDHWSVPLVARWVPSGQSDMALFALDVTNSETEVTRHVSELSTRPFRVARAEELLAEEKTFTYPAQAEDEVGTGNQHDETRTVTAFTPESAQGEEQHYYLQVGEGEDSVALRFWTQEPYFNYHQNGDGLCPVTVTATFAGQSGPGEPLPITPLTPGWGEEDEEPFFPASLVVDPFGTRKAQNSVDLPARGQWTVANIPLRKVSEAANADHDPYNTITVTIQSPNGAAESVYVFHIERLMTPQSTLGVGNTPAGMILRDDSTLWETEVDWGAVSDTVSGEEDLVAHNKASALNYFASHHTFQNMPIRPSGTANQEGAIYNGVYNTTAWIGDNPDLDPTAVVAYQDMAFNDPGVSFVDSEGRTVHFGEDADLDYQTCVTRTLRLTTTDVLSASTYDDDPGRPCYYYVDDDGVPGLTEDPDKAAQTLRRSDGSDPVDLQGLIVLPGVYTAEYAFRDPDRPGDEPVVARRTVVVLPTPGDVDMDGAVTNGDALALTAKAAGWEGKRDQLHRLLYTRVYNIQVGPPGQLQTLNAAAIRGGFQPLQGVADAVGYSDYLYLPLPWDGEDEHARKTWDEVTELSTTGAQLRLEFLGVEQGTWNRSTGATTNISGPWAASTQADKDGVSIVAGSPARGQGDVFWMGVYLDDPGAMAGQRIQELSVALVYDSTYVRPALVYPPGDRGADEGENENQRWQLSTLLPYNFLSGSKDATGKGMTLFSGMTGNEYTYANSVMEQPYVTHYSKVKGELELDYTDEDGLLDSGRLKEVVYSLQRKQGGATMQAGCLLVLPFQLIRHPEARLDGESTARLVELAAGMRDFSVVLSPAVATTRSIFEPFSAKPLAGESAELPADGAGDGYNSSVQPLAAASGSVYAFSAQDSIYGNTTQNIRAELTYVPEEGRVPIGKDNTVRVVLKDGDGNDPVYDTETTIVDMSLYEGTVTGELPPGLELDPNTFTISGTPQRAGEYQFTVNGLPYQINVQPKTLHYQAAAAVSYYGEPEFRGYSASRTEEGLREFTFTYDRSDLSARDQAAAQTLYPGWTAEGKGSAQELKAILDWEKEQDSAVTYTLPVFYAEDPETLGPVRQKANVGKYNIRPENVSTSTNYQLSHDILEAGQLTIEARPVWIHSLVMPADRSGSRIYNDESGANQELTAQETAGEEFIRLTFDESEAAVQPDGSHQLGGLPLTGDARVAGDTLTLRFAAEYVPNAADEEYVRLQMEQGGQVAYRFALSDDEETRDLRVTRMETSFDNTGNYIIRNLEAPLQPEDCHIQGTVVRRGVEAIAFVTYPGVLLRNPDGTPVIQAYYGDTVHDEDLTVRVTRGAGDGADNVGDYVYNNPLLLPMELHYNWVSPEEKAEGERPENRESLVGTGWNPNAGAGEPEDLHPYNGTTPLTPAMDGWYLCAAVKKYEVDNREDKYIKVYSEYPVRVEKRTITLTVQPTNRYYGEENGQLRYTYNLNGFTYTEAEELRNWVTAQAGGEYADPTYDGAEMEEFFRTVLKDENFVAPTLEVAKTCAIPRSDDDRVTSATPVGNGRYYVVIHGASASNYAFAYHTYDDQTSSGPGAFGSSLMTMIRRPVVIQEILSPAGGREGYQTIYADTKNLFLQNQTAPGTQVTFALPEHDEEATYFFRHGGGGDKIRMSQTYATDEAVLARDMAELSVRYSVRFMCDPGHYRWLGFDNNYYDVATITENGGVMEKDVVIADVELQGAAASNYEVVYDQASPANQRTPNDVVGKTYNDPTHQGVSATYLIHGTGTVTLRGVTDIVLQEVGETEYTYGDAYAPYRAGRGDGTAMTVAVRYETTVDESHHNGDVELNDHAQSEVVTYQVNSGVSNFLQRGLTIYYLQPGQSAADAIAAGQTLDHNSPMIPADHDGARLFVGDWRREGDDPIFSEVSQQSLQVSRRSLTFTVQDAHRFYGETLHVNSLDPEDEARVGTTAFTYSFPTEQLAPRDQEALAELRGVAVSDLPETSTEEDLKALAQALAGTPLRMDLVDPTYTADPGPTQPVGQEGWGIYPIDITTHDLRNYQVTGQPGALYVYPRPVWVTDVRTSETDPVYTIYNRSNTMTFTSQLDTRRVVLRRSNEFLVGEEWIDSAASPCVCSDAIPRNLPLSGSAALAGDSLAFTVQIWFYDEPDFHWTLDAGTTDYARDQVEISFRELRHTDTARNYNVTNAATFSQGGFWGAVKLRSIDEIFITRAPRTHYTYGESLDLSDLQVTIRYKALEGLGETNVVDYLGPDSFRAVGLYVNYWYPGDPIPGGRKPSATTDGEKDPPNTTTQEEDEQRRAMPTAIRRADSGDHLTIAPTHDTQRYLTDPVPDDPLARPFAANGKYLIVSAFQDGEGQFPAVPKILGAPVEGVAVDGGVSYESESEPTPIVVDPLPLRYDLTAADKTYDGTTQAAGTLTLENVFDAVTQEQVEEKDGVISSSMAQIRDVVYVPMGAGYEDHGADAAHSGYDSYFAALEGGKISFTTGVYQPGGAAPLGDNGALTWAEGYTWGQGLTFTFANPNVHYLEPGESEPAPIGTEELAAYWRANQAANTVVDQWDRYGEVCRMPVEVTGMALAGPDAANYTWAVDGTAQAETEVTMLTRAAETDHQAAAPYATIHKANRGDIPSLAGAEAALPYLQTDEHTNVVRLFYDQSLSVIADNNNAAQPDDYRDELHFEYALYYEDENGLMAQWAGPTGRRAYQDTAFFGGELISLPVDPAYVPDSARLPQQEQAGEDLVRKGQRYRWAEEDSGVSPLGLREDAGVVQDWAAYPGGAEQAQERYGWYYDLYTWGPEGQARQPLPRGTVFYPLVRLSETHNYNPSPCLTGDLTVPAAALDEAQLAVGQLAGGDEDGALTADAREKSQAVFAAAAAMRQAAEKLSADRVALDAALAQEGTFPEEGRELIGFAPAVRTFLQRLDLISASRERSAGGDEAEYLVRILEDVWFTDTLAYPDVKNMNAVVYNDPTRYYNYYWDVDKSAQIKFGDQEMPIDFDTVMTIQIRQRQADGSTAELSYTYDPAATNHTAQIYVSGNQSSSQKVLRDIRIVPDTVYARLGDAPFQLDVVTEPALPSNRRYTWSTSDPSVVTVDQSGLLTFRGVGTATITVTSTNGRRATALVMVTASVPEPQFGGALFDRRFQGPWMELDQYGAFRPHEGMTRGELVLLLDRFLNPSAQWQATQELAYVDVTGREKYYEALRRLTGAGIVVGVPGGAFAGDQLATRAEFVAMLARALELDVTDTRGMAHAFADADETGTWAYAYIDALAKVGAIRGVGDGAFAPNRPITREETAAMIARLLVVKLDENQPGLRRPSDMTPENWSYPAVLQAINTVLIPD